MRDFEVALEVYNFMVEEKEGKQLDWRCSFCKKGYDKLHNYMKKMQGQQSELLNSSARCTGAGGAPSKGKCKGGDGKGK